MIITKKEVYETITTPIRKNLLSSSIPLCSGRVQTSIDGVLLAPFLAPRNVPTLSSALPSPL